MLCSRLVNPYVQPVLYIRKPGDDNEQTIRFPDDDPFFSEVSNLIDIIEDIEEDPDAAQILSTYEGQSSHVKHWNYSNVVKHRQMLSELTSLLGRFGRLVSALVQPNLVRVPKLQKRKRPKEKYCGSTLMVFRILLTPFARSISTVLK